MSVYDYQGNVICTEGSGGTSIPSYIVKGINHRGYNYSTSGSGSVVINNADGGPENTLPAYVLSAQKGFKYVECDVAFTSDNVPVLLHDSTINRTSNGTGSIASMTLAQAQAYKFNYILGTEIAGFGDVTIPTLADFLKLCRKLSLHPYIEIKTDVAYSQAQIESIVDLVESNGMKGNVTYISFSDTFLGYIKNYDERARLGYLRAIDTGQYPVDATAIATAQALMTGKNEVFINARAANSTIVQRCKDGHIPLETWYPSYQTANDTQATIKNLDAYVTGATSNKYDAGKVLYDDAIGS